MKFRKDNRILCGQDCRYYHGIPSGVDFKVERFGHGYKLTAHGYGVHGYRGSYGNGALYVMRLNSKQRARFETALKEWQK